MPPLLYSVQLRLPPELYKLLRRRADSEQRSLSAMARILLDETLKSFEQRVERPKAK